MATVTGLTPEEYELLRSPNYVEDVFKERQQNQMMDAVEKKRARLDRKQRRTRQAIRGTVFAFVILLTLHAAMVSGGVFSVLLGRVEIPGETAKENDHQQYIALSYLNAIGAAGSMLTVVALYLFSMSLGVRRLRLIRGFLIAVFVFALAGVVLEVVSIVVRTQFGSFNSTRETLVGLSIAMIASYVAQAVLSALTLWGSRI